MADYWDMMAQQESGLNSTDLDAWSGEAYNYAGTLTDFGKSLNLGGADQSLPLDATAIKNAGMLETPSGWATEADSSFLGKMFQPISKAMSATDGFLRSFMDDKTLSVVYGSAILAGAQGIMSYLNNEKSMENATALTQAKYVEEAKVRQEGYTREDEARARESLVAKPAKVQPKAATTPYKAPGYAASIAYGQINKRYPSGLLGS